MSYRSHRRDANHLELVALARQLGGHVDDTSQVGDGVPDLYVWRPGAGYMAVEVKAGREPLRPSQVDRQRQAPVLVWRTAADVFAWFNICG